MLLTRGFFRLGDDSGQKDLLGDPWRELPDRRGRPKHRVTGGNRNKVSILRAAGWLQKEIAVALGVSEPTLREYYFAELEHGGILRRAEVLFTMHRLGVVDGQPSILKAFASRLDAGDTLPKATRKRVEAPVAPKGKKEQLQEAADGGHEGTVWGSLLPN